MCKMRKKFHLPISNSYPNHLEAIHCTLDLRGSSDLDFQTKSCLGKHYAIYISNLRILKKMDEKRGRITLIMNCNFQFIFFLLNLFFLIILLTNEVKMMLNLRFFLSRMDSFLIIIFKNGHIQAPYCYIFHLV